MSSLQQNLGKCIRSLRQEAGMSQVVFGEKCGFYQTYLSRVELGKANPTINAIEVIANGLGLSVFGKRLTDPPGLKREISAMRADEAAATNRSRC